MVTCEICKRQFGLIASRHLAMHGLSISEYGELYPDACLRDDNINRFVSLKLTGVPKSEIHRANISKGLKGKPKSPAHAEQCRENGRRNLQKVNQDTKVREIRRGTMRRVAASWNRKRSENPDLERRQQAAATAGKSKSVIFKEVARRTLAATRERPDVREKVSRRAAENAQRNGIASCRNSVRVFYTDRKGRKYHLRSLSELRFAYWMDCGGLDWDYEIDILDCGVRSTLVDFSVTSGGFRFFVEIKGYKTKEAAIVQSLLEDKGIPYFLLTRKDLDLTGILSFHGIVPNDCVSFSKLSAQNKPRELLGSPESLLNHSMAENGECDGIKISRIGQSAAEHLNHEWHGEGSETIPSGSRPQERPKDEAISVEKIDDIVRPSMKVEEAAGIGCAETQVTQYAKKVVNGKLYCKGLVTT